MSCKQTIWKVGSCAVLTVWTKMIESSLIRIEKSPFSQLGKGKTRLTFLESLRNFQRRRDRTENKRTIKYIQNKDK
jgi:hypothetical protein